MISVLICSINPEFLNRVTANIHRTIGVPFEIISYDNRNVKKGICEVYNILAEKACYPYLCFAHEYIILTTENWGEKIANIFSRREDIGVIGVAGSKYK